MDGQGTFSELQVMTNGIDGLNRLKVDDLDNDGDQDILTLSSDDDRIGFFENIEGTGTFKEQQSISTLIDFGVDVTLVDLDNDGDKDVISISIRDQKIAWFENLGDNQFGTQNIINNAVEDMSTIVTGDLDNDGYSDILIGTEDCLLYTSPSPRDRQKSRMPSSA